MNRFVRRFATPVAVLVATAGLLIVHAERASAEIYEYQGFACNGDRLVRCGWVNLDSSANLVRAYARAWDATTAVAWVSVVACVQHRDGPRDTTPTTVGTCGTGGANEVANAASQTFSCSNSREYRALVLWTWDPPGSARETGDWASYWIAPNVC